jgi:hypothetical protein
MNWLLRLYPARWRERYGEEFGAVLASQSASVGLVLNVLAGAIDAYLHPQIQQLHSEQINSKQTPGDDAMTLAMLQRCAAGGPKRSPQDKRAASRSMIISALIMSALYLGLTKIYRGALPVQAFGYASVPFLSLVYEQTAYLRNRPRLTQAFLLGAGYTAMYAFMRPVCVIGSKL